mmetsp:Transcript_126271/g.188437  ORF Transcript_126271/g.188437 Transcript_126271/m.188437 type:complete len:87 (-) Transcript_126271:356-616(-)
MVIIVIVEQVIVKHYMQVYLHFELPKIDQIPFQLLTCLILLHIQLVNYLIHFGQCLNLLINSINLLFILNFVGNLTNLKFNQKANH